MSSSAIFASMVSDAVCQAIRYPGIMPSSLWSSGPWPHIGVADERPYMSELVRGPPLLVTDLGDLVATAMVRFCGVELPQSFVASFNWQNRTERGPEQRLAENGALPWATLHWTWSRPIPYHQRSWPPCQNLDGHEHPTICLVRPWRSFSNLLPGGWRLLGGMHLPAPRVDLDGQWCASK